jgi:tellurite resistance protein
MNQNAACAHCGALLRSGQYDWVLAEITQGSEWVGGARADPPGLTQLLERDPEFSLQDLEDRASVMFWRRNAAERLGKVDPLRKVASPGFCDAFAAELRSPARAREFYGECAVGAVDTLAIFLNDDDGWDRALVEVRWAGTPFIATSHGSDRTGPPVMGRLVLELSRRSDAMTDADRAISSAHCPGCGAPEPGNTASNACPFCGAVLNDGTRGWILTAVRTSAQARMKLAERTASAPEQLVRAPAASEALAWMIGVALVDGQLDPRERQMLARAAEARQLTSQQLDAMITAAQQRNLDLDVPADSRVAKTWLAAMIQTALVDGNFTRQEYALIRRTGLRAGVADYDIRLLVRSLRRSAFSAARSALRSDTTSFV